MTSAANFEVQMTPSSVLHPQTNEQVKAITKIIKNDLKNKLDNATKGGSKSFLRYSGKSEQP